MIDKPSLLDYLVDELVVPFLHESFPLASQELLNPLSGWMLPTFLLLLPRAQRGPHGIFSLDVPLL